jgi:hypothetical protein
MKDFNSMYDEWMQELIADAKEMVTALNALEQPVARKKNVIPETKFLSVNSKNVYSFPDKTNIRITA